MPDRSATEITVTPFCRYGKHMNNIIYIVGLVVIVLFVLGAIGFS
jgi:hypothetical protein